MTKEAIILAGGFGTRLQGVISDIPKPMAPVAGKPFLEYLLLNLLHQGISRVILSVGYKHELILNYFGDNFQAMDIVYAIENEPLGTGGAISLALKKLKGNEAFILNGDSFIDVNLKHFDRFCKNQNSLFGMVLKEMTDFDRYGTVVLEENRVVQFEEKKAVMQGIINCGLYYINKNFLKSLSLPTKYSFETQFMENFVTDCLFSGFLSNGYFIDIGIPEDYSKAQKELPTQILK